MVGAGPERQSDVLICWANDTDANLLDIHPLHTLSTSSQNDHLSSSLFLIFDPIR